MSTNATTIIAAIKVQAASVLGTSYVELAYSNNLDKNSFNGNFKRYGVLPADATEISSITNYVTIDQNFELILIDSFINTAMSDSAESAKGSALQDLAYDVYRNLISTKCGVPNSVIQVHSFTAAKPETIEDKAVTVRASFSVKYRALIA